MGRFFDKTPQAGMPISLQGLAKGLAAMAYALEHMSVTNGSIEWSLFGAPIINPSGGGNGTTPEIVESARRFLESLGTIEDPTHVLCKNADGEIGWVETCSHADEHPESEEESEE